jgi:hypothetical protein
MLNFCSFIGLGFLVKKHHASSLNAMFSCSTSLWVNQYLGEKLLNRWLYFLPIGSNHPSRRFLLFGIAQTAR